MSECASLCNGYQAESPQETGEGVSCVQASQTCDDTFACFIPTDVRAGAQCSETTGSGGGTSTGGSVSTGGLPGTGGSVSTGGLPGTGGSVSTGGSGATGNLCTDTCVFAFDTECDDGGPGALFDVCDYGSDCSDCGPRPALQ